MALRSCWHTQGSAAIAMGQALQACATLHHQMAGAHQASPGIASFFLRWTYYKALAVSGFSLLFAGTDGTVQTDPMLGKADACALH